MGIVACKWVFPFLLSFSLFFSGALSGGNVRGVNLGGWLVVEGWMTPYLFDANGIPNGDMLDGRRVQFKSVALQKYITAEDGGGSSVSVNRSTALDWERFKLWRVSKTKYQFRSYNGNFLSCVGEGCSVSAMAKLPSTTETFEIERNGNGRVHIKLSNGRYVQATSSNQLTANYPGVPGWDNNKATFEMTILPGKMGGEYQLSNGLGPDIAWKILTRVPNSQPMPDSQRIVGSQPASNSQHVFGNQRVIGSQHISNSQSVPGSQCITGSQPTSANTGNDTNSVFVSRFSVCRLVAVMVVLNGIGR